VKYLNQANTPRQLASAQNTRSNFLVFLASTLPTIHINKIGLAPSASLCMLVNTSGFLQAGLRDFRAFLSTAELHQYSGIVLPEERHQRQVTRALLRTILGVPVSPPLTFALVREPMASLIWWIAVPSAVACRIRAA